MKAIKMNNLKDDTKAKFGMWLFLLTELVLFSALFIAYAFLRYKYAHDFHSAASLLSIPLGLANTFVLLTSSFFVALSEYNFEKNNNVISKNFLLFTIFSGILFLLIKSFEWGEKFSHNIYPDSDFFKERGMGEGIFFDLYFVMTGLHGLHVLIGIVLLIVIFLKLKNNSLTKKVIFSNIVLYWHFVDIVWIYLFPLFYLSA